MHGIVFRQDWVDVTPSNASQWEDVDISAYVPASATGAVLLLQNATVEAVYREWKLREDGSANTTQLYRLFTMESCIAFVGLVNQIFEAYINSASEALIKLIGYTDAAATFIDPCVIKSLSANETWEDVDVSGEVAVGATAVILCIDDIGADKGTLEFGCQTTGSTDDRVMEMPAAGGGLGWVVGLDGNRKFEGYAEDKTKVVFKVIGYFTDCIVAKDNGVDISLTSDFGWQIGEDVVDETSNLATGMLIVAVNNYPSYVKGCIRKAGSSDDPYDLSHIRPIGMVMLGCGLTSEQTYDGKIQGLEVDFYVLCYFEEAEPWVRAASVAIGTSVTASRAFDITREAEAALGIVGTGKRSLASVPINIGPEAIDRASAQPGGVTFIAGGVKTLDLEIGAADCEAHECDDGTGFDASMSHCRCDSNPSASDRWNTGLVFKDATIPKGRPIISAYLTLYVAHSTTDNANCDIYGEDEDEANNFTDEADVTSRTRTTATVPWVNDNLGVGWVQSPNFRAAVQEVIDRDGWVSGNNLCVLIDGKDAISKYFRFYNYELGSAYAPRLHVEYLDTDLDDLADGTGVIASVEILAAGDMTGVKVGTFYWSTPSNFTCRDYAIIGNVGATEEKQIITTDEDGIPFAIEVNEGDYWGIYYETGELEWDVAGGSGVWVKDGDQFDEGEQEYSVTHQHTFSCHGVGYSGTGWTRAATVAVGIVVTSPIHYVRKAVVAIGVAVVSTRVWVAQRLAEAALGILPTASRATVIARTALPYVGIKILSFKNHLRVRAATVAIGVAVIAVVGTWRSYERLASVYVGVKTTASRATIISRSAAISLGIAVSALLVSRFMEISKVAIGIKTTAARTWIANRTADVAIGIMSKAVMIPTILRHLRVEVITAQYRQVKVITAQNRLVKVVTAQYRKVKSLITREE